jgi:hypothetical protein
MKMTVNEITYWKDCLNRISASDLVTRFIVVDKIWQLKATGSHLPSTHSAKSGKNDPTPREG